MPTPARASRECRFHGRVSDRKIAARCPDVPRDPVNCRQSPDYHNLNNKFRLQSARSTTNEKRAADPKLARLRRHFVASDSSLEGSGFELSIPPGTGPLPAPVERRTNTASLGTAVPLRRDREFESTSLRY